MVKKTLQNVVELEHIRVSVIRTIAVREKSYWNKGKYFGCPEDAAAFAKPLFENADKEHLLVCCLDEKVGEIESKIA